MVGMDTVPLFIAGFQNCSQWVIDHNNAVNLSQELCKILIMLQSTQCYSPS